MDFNYNNAAPISIPASPAGSPALSNPTPTTAPASTQPINPQNNPPKNNPSIIFVPTTIINPGAVAITSSVPVLFSPITSLNAFGNPVITSVPIPGTTTVLYIPITSINAAGENPVTTSSVVTAVIAGMITYFANTAPLPRPVGPASPKAAPGSPGGPASVITFSSAGIPSILTIGSATITADSSSRFVIGGQTLMPGGAITVSSSVISLATGAAGTGVNVETETGNGIGTRPGSVIISALGSPSGTETGETRSSVVVASGGQQTGLKIGLLSKS